MLRKVTRSSLFLAGSVSINVVPGHLYAFTVYSSRFVSGENLLLVDTSRWAWSAVLIFCWARGSLACVYC